MTGLAPEPPVLRLCVRLFSVFGLLLACWGTIVRLRRERKLAAIPPRRRRRQPDGASLLQLRLIKASAVPLLIGLLFAMRCAEYTNVLWLHGSILILNGVFLYLPQFMLRGNKDARSMTGMDAFLIGLSGALAVVPGFSRMATMVSAAMRKRMKQIWQK